jgi:hypothetical protein
MYHYHYVRENVEANRFATECIGTEFQLADTGTKLNHGPRHKVLVNMVMIPVKNQMKDLVQDGTDNTTV